MAPTLSLVLPVFNEEEVLPALLERLRALLDRLKMPTEVIFVDDGSSDGTSALLKEAAKADARVRLLTLSRNFGHQPAISAGLDHALGDAVVVMDADLQDPPEVVAAMVTRWRDGYDVVYGVRRKRHGETWFKRLTAAAFYRILR
ncbi:MAG TPA: glycosyltransferase family 2 protein, partial [Myxococcaceae bacterium]|nr:glycosyltransferase family 2 protein [Myxococcaceae bacterium]